MARGREGKRAFDPTFGALFPYLGGRGVEICPALNYALREFKLKASGAGYGYVNSLHGTQATAAAGLLCRMYMGWKREEPALKPVEAIVSEPMLTDDLLALAHDLARYYRAPIGGTLAAMLPPGLESRLRRRWRMLDPALLPAGLRETAELDADGLLEDGELLRFGPARGAAAWLERLRRSRAIAAAWELRPPEVRPRRVRTIRRLPGERVRPFQRFM